MFIFGRSGGGKLFISDEEPNFSAKSKIKDFKVLCIDEKEIELSEDFLNKLSKFYIKNNLMASGNMNRIKPIDILKFTNIGAELVVIQKEKILGSILSVLFPIKLVSELENNNQIKKTYRYTDIVPVIQNKEENVHVFASTTFLNNHKKYRGKGLGMILIQRSLQLAHKQGILGAYFLNTVKRNDNAVKIKNWVFPVNPNNLDKYQIDYDRRYKSKYTFSFSPDYKIIEVNKVNNNIEEALEFYLSQVKEKKACFYPEISFWKKWIVNFNVFLLQCENKNIGIFCTNKLTSFIPSRKCELENGYVLFCVGKQPETLKAMLFRCRKDNYDLIMLQEVGDLTYSILKNVFACPVSADYLNFYNTNLSLQPQDIYFPLL